MEQGIAPAKTAIHCIDVPSDIYKCHVARFGSSVAVERALKEWKRNQELKATKSQAAPVAIQEHMEQDGGSEEDVDSIRSESPGPPSPMRKASFAGIGIKPPPSTELILVEGILERLQSSNIFGRKTWKECYCILSADCFLHCFAFRVDGSDDPEKEAGGNGAKGRKTLQHPPLYSLDVRACNCILHSSVGGQVSKSATKAAAGKDTTFAQPDGSVLTLPLPPSATEGGENVIPSQHGDQEQSGGNAICIELLPYQVR
jgi:hypothetical protein